MTLATEAIARYHKLIENEPYIELGWAAELQAQLRAAKLTNHPMSPVLRPHFISTRDHATLEKATATILSALHRAEQIVLASPAHMARLQLLPAERMLAAVDPGFGPLTMTGVLDANLHNGSLHFLGHRNASPNSVIYSDLLAEIYYDAPPVKEFRKKYKLTKMSGSKHLLQGVLKAYKEFGGKQKKPSIGIIESRPPFQPAEASENALLVEFFRKEGLTANLVAPEHVEYRNGGLRLGDLAIDIVYRSVRLQEFLVRFDLNHPIVRAYKERAVCMINNFRSEALAKRALFDLLTDEAFTAKFPAAERKAIKDFIPWTRLVQAVKTTHNGRAIDLPEYAMKHRTKLVLRPNSDSTDLQTYRGADTDDLGWEKALRQAMRNPYVIQDTIESARAVFPLFQYGSLVMKDMHVEMHPHSLGSKIHGVSSWLSVAGTSGFTTLSGLAPTFLLESK
jgi:hypothetical protein